MTDLQTSLMTIGAAIVAGVIVYNKWQENKAKKKFERAFSPVQDDALMRTREPVSGDGERKEPALHSIGRERMDPAMQAEPTQMQEQHGGLHPSSEKESPIDDLIDCTIAIDLATPMSGDKILPALHTLRHVGNKPVHFIGQREQQGWEPVTHGMVYTSLRAGVQLANRSGALNEIEYSELVTQLRQIADALDAEPDVPDMAIVMKSARALHQITNEFGAQLSVNIAANGAPWAVSTLLTALGRQGFDIRPDGRLVMQDGDGGILFSLSTNVALADETTSRLTLLLDVPCVAPLRDGFGAMIACARMLAGRLDGTVVDDGDQPLSEQALTDIAGQVNAFYGDMEAAGIAAGSTRALRLFS